MTEIDKLDYIDNSLNTYLKLKKSFQENCLGLQLFAIGHGDDYRLTLSMGQDEQGNKKVDIKEQENIPFATIIPQGMKIMYLGADQLAQLQKTKPEMLSIREWLNHAIFPLFPDDVVEYELFHKEELILSDRNEIGKLEINMKNLRELGYIMKNSLMRMKLYVVEYGATRKQLESLSYLESEKSTKDYLHFLTSKAHVVQELEKLVAEKKFEILKNRLSGIFSVDTTDFTDEKASEYIGKVPEHYDFGFEYVADIEGMANAIGGKYSNDYLYEMEYQDYNARLEQLEDFFKEKLLKVAKKA